MTSKQKNLLLSKMILKGDRQKDLFLLFKMSHTAIQNKFNGKTQWSIDQAKLIIKTYKLTKEEAYDIFLA